MKLENKVAVVTGGSRGIGFAVAEQYIIEGAKVAVCGSKLESAEAAVAKLKANHPNAEVIAVRLDVRSTEQVDAMVETVVAKWGTIDILVNNAGVSHNKPITDMTDDEWLNTMDININGMFRCTRAVAKVMKANGGGSIIDTSSLVSRNGSGNQCVYTTSKFAVNGLMRSNARELGPFGIRVNAVAPGVVMTDMAEESFKTMKNGQAMLDGMKNMTALRRTAKPIDLAGSYVFLASEDAQFVTGALIHCDGGIIM
ncbi:MAG: SDR family NAD(P)-dependent oxidoreductase [Oscillospiraceae bacterium]